MAGYPPRRGPRSPGFYAENFYHQEDFPNLRPRPAQILPGLGYGGPPRPRMFGGFYRPGVHCPQQGPFPASPYRIRYPIQYPQSETIMDARALVPRQQARIRSVSGRSNAGSSGMSYQEKIGGTGVFLPAPLPTTGPAPNCKQGEKCKEKVEAEEVEEEKVKAEEVEEENKEVSNSELPPGIFLPEEWEY